MEVEECFFDSDKFTMNNIIINYCNFKFEKIVLKNSHEKKKYEGESNNYYKILKYNDKYRLYYRASNNLFLINNRINPDPRYDLECFCVAESNDGLNFSKININRNNILMRSEYCHNFFPNLINNKFYGLSGTQINNNGIHLFDSEDGIKWKYKKQIIKDKNILQFFNHKNHFDSHNSINFNNLDNFHYIHIRHNNIDNRRMTQLIKTQDFKTYLDSELVKINNNYDYEIYNINITKNDDYLCFIGIPNYAEDYQTLTKDNKNYKLKKKFIKDIIISKNGINFKTFIPNINLKQMNKNGQICPVNGYIKNKNKKKIYFYFQNNVHQINHEVQCYSIPYNRFKGHYSIKYGTLETDILNLKNIDMKINFKSITKKSFIIVELLDINNNRLNISKIINGNSFDYKIEWFKNNITNLKNVFLRFHIYNSILYSYNYFKENTISLDYLWSKGIFKRTKYMLKSTHCCPDEKNIINLINNNDKYLWIRNNLNKFKIRDLDYLSLNLEKLKMKKIIIVGDGDDPIPSSYNLKNFEKILNHEKIEKIYIQNYDGTISHEKIKHYPIGLDLHTPKFLLDFNYNNKIDYYMMIRNSNYEYNVDKIFCDTYNSNNHQDRIDMANKIKKNKFIDFLKEPVNFKEITKLYRKYKFVLSPRGNGLDCHRTWELFLLGCIVITKTSSLDDMWIKNNLPVVILNDYNDLNENNFHLRLKFWYKRYNNLTNIDNILPKFKNSYWLNN